jgi:hypothetical protein
VRGKGFFRKQFLKPKILHPYFTGIEPAIAKLKNVTNKIFTKLFQNGSMHNEYFAPQTADIKSPRHQDEIYVFASVTSSFNRNGEIIQCKSGNVLFVPAGMVHSY